MGSSSGIACNKCNYTKNFTVEIGMIYFEPSLTEVESYQIAAIITHSVYV